MHLQLADQMLLEDAQRASEEAFLEEQMLHDKLQAADWENTEDDMLREVAQESFVEYLRHQGELAQSSKPVSIRSCFQFLFHSVFALYLANA